MKLSVKFNIALILSMIIGATIAGIFANKLLQENAREEVMVKTGFWPSWPVTETKTITFPFNEINIMSNTLNTCTSLFVE